ncbi:hypothetical protein BYT27DRAFT_7188628 [Phlegmacium glaucopus]|nr:hypothetical protein BYT27DRAFT_7188628 [Phlegmacium glaucopus]
MKHAWFDKDVGSYLAPLMLQFIFYFLFVQLKDFRNIGCCPSFLISFSGPHMVISAAVLPDKLIIERLAMLWVGHSTTHDDDHVRHISRHLHALSLSIQELKDWYTTLKNAVLFDEETKKPSNHPRFYPFAHRYLSGSTMVEFEYICALQPNLSTCVTFRGRIKGSVDENEIVIKFVQRYSPEVHEILAKAGLAPALLFYGPVDSNVDYGNWKMVVMEYLEGKPSYEGDRHRDPDVSKKVLESIKVVHSEGYVLGDVRPPNVMIGLDDEVKLIDFDWAGKGGVVRYPAFMSDGIWTEGIEPMVKIEKSHDLDMYNKWFSPNSPRK